MSEPVNRPSRTPIYQRNIMTAQQVPGKKRRWVNDDDDRIEAFKQAGYTVVTKPTKVGDNRSDIASQLGSVVERPVGGGKRAVLMEIDEHYFHEDQLAKEKRLTQKERDMLPADIEDKAYYGEGVTIETDKAPAPRRGRPRINHLDGEE